MPALPMPALRLKTKLVFAITGMVVVIVATLSTLYIREVVKLRLQETLDDGSFIAQEIFDVARDPLQKDLRNTNVNVNLNDPLQVEDAIAQELQTDLGLTALLESVIGYSPTIQDGSIIGIDGRALVHTSPSLLGKTITRREDFISIAHASIWKQLGVIYGPAQVYDVRIPFSRNEMPFGEVRVGISTVFLKKSIQPILTHSLVSSGISILVCLVLAAGLSNFALRPLSAISRRLDLISAGQVELPEPPRQPSDEYGAVTSKIDRLGRQMRDVKEVFSALKENLDQMMANLQDGVMLFTSDFKAVLVSASAERFVGKPRGDMLGCRPQEIFSEDSRLGHAILDAFITRTPTGQEEIELENGRRIQISLDFIEERGERIGALLTLRDAESVHRIEDEIELSRRLAAIGRLTSGVAHEVKNPINAIVVHLEVLRQKLNQVDPDTRRHMDVIGAEIKRLDRVVQTLVDFTRPVELRLVDVDLRKLVDEVVALASPEAERHTVRIERQVGPEPLPVRVDADLMKQAVLNIVINGVQAMSGGGNLYISSRREGEGAIIAVRDEGPGIPAAIQNKIYNLYFTTKKGGSGIGLPMAYRVLQLHNGSLEFDSMEGGGATFVLRVPLAESGSAAEQPTAAPDSVKMV
jgi:signal transduction histidine kinase